MPRYPIPVWQMAKQALNELGGSQNWVRLRDIVQKVREIWVKEDVHPGTIRCQVYARCVNRHPAHDQFPGQGLYWKEQPTFVTNGSGLYRLYDESRDREIYNKAIAEDLGRITPVLITPGVKGKDQDHKLVHDDIRKELSSSEVHEILEELGSFLGFHCKREYEIPLGRIDLVWYTELPSVIPGYPLRNIPAAGFEIESSWRTRKHIKGDIVNLQALGAPISVIIQLTSSSDDPKKVQALVRNTKNSLDDLGASKIIVWTEKEIMEISKHKPL